MILLVVAFIAAVTTGVSFYDVNVIPFDLRYILAGLSFYMLTEGIVSVLRNKKVARQEQALFTQYSNAHGDFLQAKEELDQLSGVFREIKERELSLERALASLKEEHEHTPSSAENSLPLYSDVMTLLSLFQNKGRFIDFLAQDITSYEDEHVGRVARFVHQGCSEVMKEYIECKPVFEGAEGENVSLGSDFEARAYRLVGKVKDKPPYKGTVTHKGWRVKRIAIPRVVGEQDEKPELSTAAILAPAEVEVA
jgi:hypothetical protein